MVDLDARSLRLVPAGGAWRGDRAAVFPLERLLVAIGFPMLAVVAVAPFGSVVISTVPVCGLCARCDCAGWSGWAASLPRSEPRDGWPTQGAAVGSGEPGVAGCRNAAPPGRVAIFAHCRHAWWSRVRYRDAGSDPAGGWVAVAVLLGPP